MMQQPSSLRFMIEKPLSLRGALVAPLNWDVGAEDAYRHESGRLSVIE